MKYLNRIDKCGHLISKVESQKCLVSRLFQNICKSIRKRKLRTKLIENKIFSKTAGPWIGHLNVGGCSKNALKERLKNFGRMKGMQ